MKYKIMTIDGECIVKDYKKRVYIISRSEKEKMEWREHFVPRRTIDGILLWKSVETGKHYLINN